MRKLVWRDAISIESVAVGAAVDFTLRSAQRFRRSINGDAFG